MDKMISLPDLLRYLVGFVAVASGLSGMFMGWKGLRATRDLKRLDLRISLRKACETLKHAISVADKVMREAEESRRHLEATPYRRGSESSNVWNARFKADGHELGLLLKHCLTRINEAHELDAAGLEAGIVECHGDSLRVGALTQRYEESIDADIQHVQATKLLFAEMTQAFHR